VGTPGGAAHWPAPCQGAGCRLRDLYSFVADGNGDGLGDLTGICERLEYLAWLGIDLIWLTPFYLSPLADHGYDVAGHCHVDPRFGDAAAFGAVVCALTPSSAGPSA